MLVVLSYLSLLTLALLDNVRGPLYPEILHDFGVSATRGSFFYAASSLVSFLSAWRGHGFLHRYNAVVLLSWASLLLGGSFIALSRIHDFDIALWACAVFGGAYGGLSLAQAVLISDSSAGEKRRRLFSGLHAMYGLASLAAPLIATLGRDSGFNWRFTFLCLAAAPIGVGLYSFGFINRARVHQVDVRPTSMSRAQWRECFLFSALLACYLWAELSLSTRLVLWLRQERAMAPDQADYYLAGFFALLCLGRIVVGALGFRGLSNFKVLGLSSAVASLLYLIGLTYDPRLLILTGLAMSPFYPVAMDQVTVHFKAQSSQALGFVIGSGSLAAVGMHLFIGLVSDHGGLTLALQICAATLLAMAVILGWKSAAVRS